MFRLLRFTRKIVLLVLVAVVAATGACAVYAGRMLVDPRALETPREADAIIVLSGTPTDRWLEAYELWREKRAPRIVLSPGYRDRASLELERRGVRVPEAVDIARGIMTAQLGVPPDVIIVMEGPMDNTAAEASATRALAVRHQWNRLIVVTSVAHTRRTALAMRRALEPARIDVQVRGSRFDSYRGAGWWRSRSDARWVLAEFPKLLAYKLGLGE